MQDTMAYCSKIAGRLAQEGKIVELKGDKSLFLSPGRFVEFKDALLGAVTAYQKSFPAEAGLPLEEALRQTPLPDARALRSLLTLMVEAGALALDENKIHTPDFTPRSEGEFLKNSQALLEICRRQGWQLLTLDELRGEMKLAPPVFSALIQSFRNSRRLALLPGGYVLTAEMESEMLRILKDIGGNVTLAEVRDRTQSSRKFILPVLEYFDSKGYTRRVGDVRVVKGM